MRLKLGIKLVELFEHGFDGMRILLRSGYR